MSRLACCLSLCSHASLQGEIWETIAPPSACEEAAYPLLVTLGTAAFEPGSFRDAPLMRREDGARPLLHRVDVASAAGDLGEEIRSRDSIAALIRAVDGDEVDEWTVRSDGTWKK